VRSTTELERGIRLVVAALRTARIAVPCGARGNPRLGMPVRGEW
jgi:hypothetical protein